MNTIEKIILTIIVYTLIMFFVLIAVMGYFMVQDGISVAAIFILVVLVYTLGLIEEQ